MPLKCKFIQHILATTCHSLNTGSTAKIKKGFRRLFSSRQCLTSFNISSARHAFDNFVVSCTRTPAGSMGLFISNFRGELQNTRNLCSSLQCGTAVQGHPRSFIAKYKTWRNI